MSAQLPRKVYSLEAASIVSAAQRVTSIQQIASRSHLSNVD